MRTDKRKRASMFFVLIVGHLLMALVAGADYFYYQNRLYPGVYLKDMDMGGRTVTEVENLLLNLELTLISPDGSLASTPLKELGIIIDHQETLAAGRRLGRQNFGLRSYLERLKLHRDGAYIPLQFFVDAKKLRQGVDTLAQSFNKEAQNAHFQISTAGTEAQLIREKNGFLLDNGRVEQAIVETVSHRNAPLALKTPIGETLYPDITASLLEEKGIEGLMSSFSTTFNRDNAPRTHNITLGASLLNDYFLPPGKVLSVNAILGDSTAEKGYQEAPIISGGRLVSGLGGGLCQISSTLYNAALLANLNIVERRNHGLTVSYMDPGRDATIAFGSTDLRIYNNRDHHIWVKALIEKDQLIISLFGAPLEERVEITTKTLHTYEPGVAHQYDPDLSPGEEEVDEGYPGYLVEVWKTVYLGDQVISQKKISVDYYNPHPTIIRRGPNIEKSS
jgi:vancomycin resistance protein YoaR